MRIMVELHPDVPESPELCRRDDGKLCDFYDNKGFCALFQSSLLNSGGSPCKCNLCVTKCAEAKWEHEVMGAMRSAFDGRKRRSE